MSDVEPYASALRAIPVRERIVLLAQGKTAFWDYGPQDRPVDLVMVHGFRGDHHGLEPFVAALGAGLRILIPDLPGFGSSDALPSPASLPAYAQWLCDFTRAVAVSVSSAILGHSFGSIVVSAAIAQKLPAGRVILINPIAANALKGPRGMLTQLAVGYYKAAAALPEGAGNALLKNPGIVRIMSATMAKTKDPELRRWIHAQHDQYFSAFASRDSVLEAFTTSVSHDVSEFASDFQQPVLLVVGEIDDITALPAQHELASKISNARMEVIESVGHLVHYEAPEQAAVAIRKFLSENE
jgi:pimeloyl-ACP methyl ester carboxylesterase